MTYMHTADDVQYMPTAYDMHACEIHMYVHREQLEFLSNNRDSFERPVRGVSVIVRLVTNIKV